MTRVWDEKLEGTGYEETWNIGETVTAGNTLDEDQATSGVTGAPGNWHAQCLKCETTAISSNAYIYHSEDFGGTLYYRLGFIIAAENLANDGTLNLAWYADSTFSGGLFCMLFQNTGGDLVITVSIYTDSTNTFQSFSSFATVSLDTPYVFEFVVDESAGAAGEWDWWLDGVRQPNDQDASDPVTTPGNLGTGYLRPTELLQGIVTASVGGTNTVYMDNIAIDNAERVGLPPTADPLPPLLPPFEDNANTLLRM